MTYWFQMDYLCGGGLGREAFVFSFRDLLKNKKISYSVNCDCSADSVKINVENERCAVLFKYDDNVYAS